MAIRIEEALTPSDELRSALNALVPQLSSSSPALSSDELSAIVSSPATRLLIALDEDDAIVGTLTLALFRIPTGVRTWIEDVIVDERARGAGVGEQLVLEACRIATAEGARTVDLTSRPSREAANRLYLRTGFEPRETNVYRWRS